MVSHFEALNSDALRQGTESVCCDLGLALLVSISCLQEARLLDLWNHGYVYIERDCVIELTATVCCKG